MNKQFTAALQGLLGILAVGGLGFGAWFMYMDLNLRGGGAALEIEALIMILIGTVALSAMVVTQAVKGGK